MKRLFWIFFVLTGCVNSIDPDPSSLGINYFPLQTGDYYVYNITTINFNLNGSIDSLEFLLKEEVVDSFPSTDEQGFTFVINRYKKDVSDPDWTFEEVVSARATIKTTVVTEGNTDFIKLVYPVQEGLRWDGNSLNDLEPDEYEIRMLSHPFTVDSITFANTVHVFHADLLDPAKISADDYRVEVFAEDIGLVFKETIIKEYCDYSAGGPCSEPTVLLGYEYEQKLIEFGKG